MASHSFTDEQIERALRALVLADMRPKVARQRLLADGIDISERTLRDWKADHAERLDTLAAQRVNWVQDDLAEREERIAAASTGFLEQRLQHLLSLPEEKWEGIAPATQAKTLVEVSKIANSSINNLRILRDQPTQITESRSLAALLQSLAKHESVFPGLKDSPLIQGTAEEVTDQSSLTQNVEAADEVSDEDA